MSDFDKNYQELNAPQKQAVDTIDGPLMVVAGPGTGKTQLLAMRVANILRLSDVNPANILCLTFTENGAIAMRQRLEQLIGPGSAKVAVHTFHSFGSEIINQYPDYFYRGADFKPASELASYEILLKIFEALPASNPLCVTMNQSFTYLNDASKAISYLKQSSITPDELLKILEHNQSFIDFAAQPAEQAFDGTLSKKTLIKAEELLNKVSKYQDQPLPLPGYQSLSLIFNHSLQRALDACQVDNSTKPLRAWRDTWLSKNQDSKFIFKDQKRGERLQALSLIYREYLTQLEAAGLYDFDDMILRVVHRLEVSPDLRFDLQERFLYILVDEFQDTNTGQMRLLNNLTNNPVNEGKPNLMVVGDDDQAIFRFQGADISNILDFKNNYESAPVISLTDNYRSNKDILNIARPVAEQIEQRLETLLDVSKKPKVHQISSKVKPSLHEFSGPAAEAEWVADQISQELKAGKSPNEIAVIARRHKQLEQLLPYLKARNIAVTYERQDDVLSSPIVKIIKLTVNLIDCLNTGDHRQADVLLAQLLAHPAFKISALELFKISITAAEQNKTWQQIMLEGPEKFKQIMVWLLNLSKDSSWQPLEIMLDKIMGELKQPAEFDFEDPQNGQTDVTRTSFNSPFKDYFFDTKKLKTNPSDYLTHLSNLASLRNALLEWRPNQTLSLSNFNEFINLYQSSNLKVQNNSEFQAALESVSLLTVHRAKGREFDSVYVLGLSDRNWGEKSAGRASKLALPTNLPLEPAGDQTDERLRLLFVALTRARFNLILSYATSDSKAKPAQLVAYLLGILSPQVHDGENLDPTQIAARAQTAWDGFDTTTNTADLSALLKPVLKNYALSPTHLNNFLNVAEAGPKAFLVGNLLRFPQAQSPYAAYGSAVHTALKLAHQHLSSSGERQPIEDVLKNFENLLSLTNLDEVSREFFLKKGAESLNVFLQLRYDSFDQSQIAELSFAAQPVTLGSARIRGNIDLMELNTDKTKLTIADYKTGKALLSWRGKTAYDKIKLYKYRQQLLFYKLLVENSPSFAGKQVTDARLEFVEPLSGDIKLLDLEFDKAELARLQKLIEAVWQRIQKLDFPDTSGYSPDIKGIIDFENHLIDNL